MTTETQSNDAIRRHNMAILQQKLNEQIVELATKNDPFSNRLRHVLAAHQHEIARKLREEPLTDRYLQRVLAHYLMAMLLMKQALDKLDHIPIPTPEERRVIKRLSSAFASFSYALKPSPEVSNPTFTPSRLPFMLWVHIGISCAEAEQDAAEIIRILDTPEQAEI